MTGAARLQCSVEEARVADVDQAEPSAQGGEGLQTRLVFKGRPPPPMNPRVGQGDVGDSGTALHAGLSLTRHTSHVTRHTSHVTRQTSHVTRHTSHFTGKCFEKR